MMKLKLTSMNNKIDLTPQIESQRNNFKTEFMLPEIKVALIRRIRIARKEKREE